MLFDPEIADLFMVVGGTFGDPPPDRVYIVALIGQPGIRLFGTKLEWEHFLPGTPDNKLFRVETFEHNGMPHVFIDIPLNRLITTHALCFELGNMTLEEMDEYLNFYIILDKRTEAELSDPVSMEKERQRELELCEQVLKEGKRRRRSYRNANRKKL